MVALQCTWTRLVLCACLVPTASATCAHSGRHRPCLAEQHLPTGLVVHTCQSEVYSTSYVWHLCKPRLLHAVEQFCSLGSTTEQLRNTFYHEQCKNKFAASSIALSSSIFSRMPLYLLLADYSTHTGHALSLSSADDLFKRVLLCICSINYTIAAKCLCYPYLYGRAFELLCGSCQHVHSSCEPLCRLISNQSLLLALSHPLLAHQWALAAARCGVWFSLTSEQVGSNECFTWQPRKPRHWHTDGAPLQSDCSSASYDTWLQKPYLIQSLTCQPQFLLVLTALQIALVPAPIAHATKPYCKFICTSILLQNTHVQWIGHWTSMSFVHLSAGALVLIALWQRTDLSFTIAMHVVLCTADRSQLWNFLPCSTSLTPYEYPAVRLCFLCFITWTLGLLCGSCQQAAQRCLRTLFHVCNQNSHNGHNHRQICHIRPRHPGRSLLERSCEPGASYIKHMHRLGRRVSSFSFALWLQLARRFAVPQTGLSRLARLSSSISCTDTQPASCLIRSFSPFSKQVHCSVLPNHPGTRTSTCASRSPDHTRGLSMFGVNSNRSLLQRWTILFILFQQAKAGEQSMLCTLGLASCVVPVIPAQHWTQTLPWSFLTGAPQQPHTNPIDSRTLAWSACEYFFPQIFSTPLARLIKPDFTGTYGAPLQSSAVHWCTLCIICISALLGLPRLKHVVAHASARILIGLRWSLSAMESVHGTIFSSSPFSHANRELGITAPSTTIDIGVQTVLRTCSTASQHQQASTSVAVQCDLTLGVEHTGHDCTRNTSTTLPRHLSRAFTLGTAFGRLSTDGFRRLATHCGTPSATLLDWWRRWQQALLVASGIAADPVVDIFFDDNSVLALPR